MGTRGNGKINKEAEQYKIYLYYIYGYLMDERVYRGKLTREDIIGGKELIKEVVLTHQDKKQVYKVLREQYIKEQKKTYLNGYEIRGLMGVVKDKAIETLLIAIKKQHIDKVYDYTFKLSNDGLSNDYVSDTIDKNLIDGVLKIDAINTRVRELLKKVSTVYRGESFKKSNEEMLGEIRGYGYRLPEELEEVLTKAYKSIKLTYYAEWVNREDFMKEYGELLVNSHKNGIQTSEILNIVLNLILDSKYARTEEIQEKDILYIHRKVEECHRRWRSDEIGIDALVDIEYDVYQNYEKILKIKDKKLRYYNVTNPNEFHILNNRSGGYTQVLFEGLYESEGKWKDNYYIYVDTLDLVINGTYGEDDLCSVLNWENKGVSKYKTGKKEEEESSTEEEGLKGVKGVKEEDVVRDSKFDTYITTLIDHLSVNDIVVISKEDIEKNYTISKKEYDRYKGDKYSSEGLSELGINIRERIDREHKKVTKQELSQFKKVVQKIIEKTSVGVREFYGYELNVDLIKEEDYNYLIKEYGFTDMDRLLTEVPKYLLKHGYIGRVHTTTRDMDRVNELVLKEYSKKYIRLRGRDNGRGYLIDEDIKKLTPEEDVLYYKVLGSLLYKDIEAVKIEKVSTIYDYTFITSDKLREDELSEFISEILYRNLGHTLPGIPNGMIKEVVESEIDRIKLGDYEVTNGDKLYGLIIDHIELKRVSKEEITEEEVIGLCGEYMEGYSLGVSELDKKLIRVKLLEAIKELCTEYGVKTVNVNTQKITNDVNKLDFNSIREIKDMYSKTSYGEKVKDLIKGTILDDIRNL